MKKISLTTVSEPDMVMVSRLERRYISQGRHMDYKKPEIRLLGTIADMTEGTGLDSVTDTTATSIFKDD